MKTENAKEFKGVEKLEIGKDYISESGNIITIDGCEGYSGKNHLGTRS